MAKLLVLAAAVAGWFGYLLYRSRGGDRTIRGLLVAFGGSVLLAMVSYYIGAVLWTFRYGA